MNLNSCLLSRCRVEQILDLTWKKLSWTRFLILDPIDFNLKYNSWFLLWYILDVWPNLSKINLLLLWMMSPEEEEKKLSAICFPLKHHKQIFLFWFPQFHYYLICKTPLCCAKSIKYEICQQIFYASSVQVVQFIFCSSCQG